MWNKTNQSKGVQRRYRPEELKAMADQAAATSMRHASRKMKCSVTAVRRAMALHGISHRRQGNFTNQEAYNLKGWEP